MARWTPISTNWFIIAFERALLASSTPSVISTSSWAGGRPERWSALATVSEQVVVGELRRRQVDRDLDVAPGGGVAAGLLQHPAADLR